MSWLRIKDGVEHLPVKPGWETMTVLARLDELNAFLCVREELDGENDCIDALLIGVGYMQTLSNDYDVEPEEQDDGAGAAREDERRDPPDQQEVRP